VRKQSPDLTLVVNLYSPDESRDALFLSNYALINVLDPLKRLPGVGEVGIFGERRYAMRICSTRSASRSSGWSRPT